MIDAPIKEDDMLANPYSLATRPEDLLPASQLLEEYLFASDNNVFKRLLSEVIKICNYLELQSNHKLYTVLFL